MNIFVNIFGFHGFWGSRTISRSLSGGAALVFTGAQRSPQTALEVLPPWQTICAGPGWPRGDWGDAVGFDVFCGGCLFFFWFLAS